MPKQLFTDFEDIHESGDMNRVEASADLEPAEHAPRETPLGEEGRSLAVDSRPAVDPACPLVSFVDASDDFLGIARDDGVRWDVLPVPLVRRPDGGSVEIK